MSLKVYIASFEELPKEEQKNRNWQKDDYCGYLVIEMDGKIVEIQDDGMEPEDVRFYRDLKWVPKAIEDAYQKGLEDGKATKN